MRYQRSYFGETSDGIPVERYTLIDHGCSVCVLNLGGIIQSLTVPDRSGKPVDVALGFDSVQAYEVQNCYVGALLGRCANRISGGKAVIGGEPITLACNDRALCHLHGGNKGFDKKIWSADMTGEGLRLRYTSPDGEEGYPGTLRVSVLYRLKNRKLSLTYRAECDRDTLCNLSSHVYFNLSGHDSGSIGGQWIQVFSDIYAPTASDGAPDGRLERVAGTPFDLVEEHRFSEGWDADCVQIARARGYDHNYFCDGTGLRPFARARSEQTGIILTVHSDMPGMQLYSGNHLHGLPEGKAGAIYRERHGFCLETQYPPNAVNCPLFTQPVLHAGMTYEHTTIYAFQKEE